MRFGLVGTDQGQISNQNKGWGSAYVCVCRRARGRHIPCRWRCRRSVSWFCPCPPSFAVWPEADFGGGFHCQKKSLLATWTMMTSTGTKRTLMRTQKRRHQNWAGISAENHLLAISFWCESPFSDSCLDHKDEFPFGPCCCCFSVLHFYYITTPLSIYQWYYFQIHFRRTLATVWIIFSMENTKLDHYTQKTRAISSSRRYIFRDWSIYI